MAASPFYTTSRACYGKVEEFLAAEKTWPKVVALILDDNEAENILGVSLLVNLRESR